MPGKSKKILIVDDSNTNVVLIEAILNKKGYRTIKAYSVKEAREIVKNELPHLILLDILMPKISGHEFLKELKDDEVTKDIPVIVVSALTDEQYKRKSEDLGAVDFIEKPVDINDIVVSVESIMKVQ